MKRVRRNLKFSWIIGGVIVAVFLLLLFNVPPFGTNVPLIDVVSDSDIKNHARSSSVELSFYMPVLKVSRVLPEEEEKEELTEKKIQELLAEKIESALEEQEKKQKEEAAKDRFKPFMASIDVYAEVGRSKTFIPLGAYAPDYAEFPTRVITAYKVEKTEITPWEEKYNEDVLLISETANVSIAVATNMLTNLRSSGYSVTKTGLDESTTEVELLHYTSGWEDTYPATLNWKVTYAGEKENLIVGYDPRGILEVKPLDDSKTIHIKAQYYDLKDEFKPKTVEQLAIEREKATLEETIELRDKRINELLKQVEKEVEEDPYDITQTTWADVLFGVVEIETFWMVGSGTGVYLGNMKAKPSFYGANWRNFGYYLHDINGEERGVILTNAHVGNMAIEFSTAVSEDGDTMWITYPGRPYVRYTQDSERYGCPAELLFYEGEAVSTMDFDAAIMLTSIVPHYEKHKALLGNSDNVREGDEVISVGNPAGMQKMLTSGVVSNTSYSVLKSSLADWWLAEGINKTWYNWILNSNFWVDTTIGVGGTSGSGLWAMGGREKGKVIALRNMGMQTPVRVARSVTYSEDTVKFNALGIDADSDTLFSIIAKENGEKIFANDDFKKLKYSISLDEFKKDEPSIEAIPLCHSGHVAIAGMNAGVPINLIKAFLQTRSIDPDHFNWEAVPDEYWLK